MTVNPATETGPKESGRWRASLFATVWAVFAGLPVSYAAAQQTTTQNATASTSDFEVLAGYTWALEHAFDAQGKELAAWPKPYGTPITVWFSNAEGKAWFGSKGCNFMSWPITLLPQHQLKTGTSTMTMAGCDEALMKLDGQLYKQLAQISSYQLLRKPSASNNGLPQLALSFADGSRWRLQGEPTPRTKYGSDGEVVLYEVAPEHARCEKSPKDESLCLRMRQVQWGVRDGKGYFFGHQAWELFPLQTFAPWQHQVGWHGVLESRRYPLPVGGKTGRKFDYLQVKEYTRFW